MPREVVLVLADVTKGVDFKSALLAANKPEVLSALRRVRGLRGQKTRTSQLQVRLTELLEAEKTGG